MQPPNEAPVTIFAIIVLWFYGLNYVRGSPIESGMTTERSGITTERSEIPDQVGDDDPSGIRVVHFCLFISLWR